MSHTVTAKSYPDTLLEAVIRDLEKRNLRNLRDHATRWMAERSKALRAERRDRKTANRWNP